MSLPQQQQQSVWTPEQYKEMRKQQMLVVVSSLLCDSYLKGVSFVTGGKLYSDPFDTEQLVSLAEGLLHQDRVRFYAAFHLAQMRARIVGTRFNAPNDACYDVERAATQLVDSIPWDAVVLEPPSSSDNGAGIHVFGPNADEKRRKAEAMINRVATLDELVKMRNQNSTMIDDLLEALQSLVIRYKEQESQHVTNVLLSFEGSCLLFWLRTQSLCEPVKTANAFKLLDTLFGPINGGSCLKHLERSPTPKGEWVVEADSAIQQLSMLAID